MPRFILHVKRLISFHVEVTVIHILKRLQAFSVVAFSS